MLLLENVVESEPPEVVADAHIPLSLFWQLGGLNVFKRTPPPPSVVGCEFSLGKDSGWLAGFVVIDPPPVAVTTSIEESSDIRIESGLPVFSRRPFNLTGSGDPGETVIREFGDYTTLIDDSWVYFRFGPDSVSRWVVNSFVRFAFDRDGILVGVRVDRDHIPTGTTYGFPSPRVARD